MDTSVNDDQSDLLLPFSFTGDDESDTACSLGGDVDSDVEENAIVSTRLEPATADMDADEMSIASSSMNGGGNASADDHRTGDAPKQSTDAERGNGGLRIELSCTCLSPRCQRRMHRMPPIDEAAKSRQTLDKSSSQARAGASTAKKQIDRRHNRTCCQQ
jgi:hypothetical protein